MLKDIAAKENALKTQFINNPKHNLIVHWTSYLDEIAEIIGCKPNLGKYKHPAGGPSKPNG